MREEVTSKLEAEEGEFTSWRQRSMFDRGTSLCVGPEVRRVACVQTTYINSTAQCEGRRQKIDTGKAGHSQHKLDLPTRG